MMLSPTPATKFYYGSEYELNQRVYMDGDDSITGRVTAVLWRVENPQVEVSWWNGGNLCSGWFSEWRLSPCASDT